MQILIIYFVLIGILFPYDCWALSEINLSRSQLAILANNLESASDDQKFEFSRIALSQLYEIYEQELNRSKNESPSKLKKRMKLHRWRNATNSYLYEIDYALSHILAGTEYVFFVNQQDRIIFTVSGMTLMISGLNDSSDQLIETNIINEFCNLFDCQNYLTDQEQQYFENSKPVVSGYWIIDKNHKADFYTHNGIIFRFNNLTDRSKKQKWAVSLTQDLIFLIKTLELTKKKGYRVDKSFISIENNASQTGSLKLTINENGDYIYLLAPTLSASIDIFPIFKSWLINFDHDNGQSGFLITVKSEKYFNSFMIAATF